MVKQVNCRETGMDCEFMVRDENEDELVELVRRHAERTHDIDMPESDVRNLMTEVEA